MSLIKKTNGNLKVMQKFFDIVTHFKNNIEWCDSFFKSLNNTIANKNTKIIVFDSSDTENQNILLSKIDKFSHLNIHYYHEPYESKGYVNEWNKSLLYSDNKKICFVHSDIVFFMKNWDLEIEKKLKDNCIVALGVLGKIKSWLMVADKDHFLSTNFGHKTSYPEEKIYEHSGLVENKENCCFLIEKSKRLCNKELLGDFFYFDDSLFCYHNSYSSRSHKNNSCPIPQQEKFKNHKRIANTKFTAEFFNTHLVDLTTENEIVSMLNKIDDSIVQIVCANLSMLDDHKDQIETNLRKYYNNILFLDKNATINSFMPMIFLENEEHMSVDDILNLLNLPLT